MAERMTKERFQQTLGALNPVGHIVLALPTDTAVRDARQALLDAGFGEDDLLSYTSRELEPQLSQLLRVTPGSAGFGYEVVLMRRYLALAQEDVGWLVVYAPHDEQAAKVAEVAKRFGAKSAVRYHTLANEDLV